jgi:protein FrlC
MNHLQFSQVAPMNINYTFYPLEYFLDSLVKFDVQAVELWGGYPHLNIEDISLFEVGKIRREIERRDLNIACFTPETCIYPINIAAEESYIRERSVAYMLKSLEIAAELGTKMMQTVSGTGYYNKPVEEAWARSRSSLEIIIRKAESLDIHVTMEPLLPDETNLVNDLEAAGRMLAEINSPRLGVNVDTVPMAIAGNTLDQYFASFGSKLTHIHLCDGPHAHVRWGDGNLPLKEYLDQLSARNYQGYLGLEICDSKSFVDPDQALQQSLTLIKASLA